MDKFRIDNDDVVAMRANCNPLSKSLFKFGELTRILTNALMPNNNDFEREKWIGEGVDCELLKASTGGWRKGKIRVRFEFIPDEPDNQEKQK